MKQTKPMGEEQEVEKEKPSTRIQELAQMYHSQGIDPYFNGNAPEVPDYIWAIIAYLDESEDK